MKFAVLSHRYLIINTWFHTAVTHWKSWKTCPIKPQSKSHFTSYTRNRGISIGNEKQPHFSNNDYQTSSKSCRCHVALKRTFKTFVWAVANNLDYLCPHLCGVCALFYEDLSQKPSDFQSLIPICNNVR